MEEKFFRKNYPLYLDQCGFPALVRSIEKVVPCFDRPDRIGLVIMKVFAENIKSKLPEYREGVHAAVVLDDRRQC